MHQTMAGLTFHPVQWVSGPLLAPRQALASLLVLPGGEECSASGVSAGRRRRRLIASAEPAPPTPKQWRLFRPCTLYWTNTTLLLASVSLARVQNTHADVRAHTHTNTHTHTHTHTHWSVGHSDMGGSTHHQHTVWEEFANLLQAIDLSNQYKFTSYWFI